MDRWRMISWDGEKGLLKTFSMAGRNGKSTVKIEIEISDGYDLSSLIHRLSDIQKEQDRPKQTAKSKPKSVARQQRLDTPAPMLMIADGRGGAR